MSTIRLGKTEDIETIFAIRMSARDNDIDREQLATLDVTEESIRERLAASPCLWIAEDGGKALGFSMADRKEGSLFALFVRPQHEARGIGTQLLAHAETFLFAEHERIWLETNGQSRAAQFLIRRGWQPRKRIEHSHIIRFTKNRSHTLQATSKASDLPTA
ncbi:GNAT family N-acetyltransferase [Oryzifoliimicrobium ureilyticus]|uniref:GNAT family N-acetyltransferase n=1 Tax=Oryzifoliimicrobium ureilyticus TaxID=3113724 RepID=UPI003076176F